MARLVIGKDFVVPVLARVWHAIVDRLVEELIGVGLFTLLH